MNQHGEVQAIGGVNEKIEGFFDICMRLEPEQFHAVMIPRSNVKHLMLKEEVIKAVKAGSFAIHAVSTIDEGIALLTGVEAGEADAEGNYPPESVNGRVVAQLERFTQKALELRRAGRKEEEEEKE